MAKSGQVMARNLEDAVEALKLLETMGYLQHPRDVGFCGNW